LGLTPFGRCRIWCHWLLSCLGGKDQERSSSDCKHAEWPPRRTSTKKVADFLPYPFCSKNQRPKRAPSPLKHLRQDPAWPSSDVNPRKMKGGKHTTGDNGVQTGGSEPSRTIRDSVRSEKRIACATPAAGTGGPPMHMAQGKSSASQPRWGHRLRDTRARLNPPRRKGGFLCPFFGGVLWGGWPGLWGVGGCSTLAGEPERRGKTLLPTHSGKDCTSSSQLMRDSEKGRE